MDLRDLKEPIYVINLIQTLCDNSFHSAFFDQEIYSKFDNNEIDEDDLTRLMTLKRNELIKKNLEYLDAALINLKIENEDKYYKLKDIILELDSRIKLIYSEEVSSFPSPPPNTIKKHIKSLNDHQPFLISGIEQSTNKDQKETPEDSDLPEIELKTIPERVRLLIELGVIDFLENKYPNLKGNKKKMTELLMQFMNVKYGSLQPIVNAKDYDDENHLKKPKLTKKVQNVINKYV